MDDNELARELQSSDNSSILIVNQDNQLQVLYCPFQVAVIRAVGLLNRGDIVLVVEVKVTRELVLVYIINGQAYYYYYFEILNQ